MYDTHNLLESSQLEIATHHPPKSTVTSPVEIIVWSNHKTPGPQRPQVDLVLYDIAVAVNHDEWS